MFGDSKADVSLYEDDPVPSSPRSGARKPKSVRVYAGGPLAAPQTIAAEQPDELVVEPLPLPFFFSTYPQEVARPSQLKGRMCLTH